MGENSQPKPESDVTFKKVSVSVSKNLVLKKSLSLGLKKFSLEKRLSLGLEKFGLKKVSVSVPKKSLSIGLKNI